MEGRRSGRSGISFPIWDPLRVFQPAEAKYCAKHPLFITWVKPSPDKPEASRPYIDGLISFDRRRKIYVSEVGKFRTTRAEFVGGPGSYSDLTRGFPEYAGNLTDISPWDWKDKKRAKVYTALKAFIANCVCPFY
ncbi:MAG: hypothetical protein LQ346_006826 [Caloplaca aetnensis]|nr:MAG: hypothetical protein LQ346_006826 [Caloplaca aetnensis]